VTSHEDVKAAMASYCVRRSRKSRKKGAANGVFPNRGDSSMMATSRSALGYGSGRRIAASTSEAMAVAATMPSPSVSTTVPKNAGRRKNVRAANLRSRAKATDMESLPVVCRRNGESLTDRAGVRSA
jgi:hypothetical protein